MLREIEQNARDARDAERQYAADEIGQGRAVLYCRGPGWPVVVLRTLEQWEARDALSRARN